MNKFAKIRTLVFAAVILLGSCGDKKDDSAFADILSRPPYDKLTDSIREEPGRDELYFRRAVLLNLDDHTEPALADFRKAWSLRKEEKYALGISTILLEKKPDSAILFLGQARRELPKSLLLGLSLARAWDAQNKTREALGMVDELLKENSQQVDLLKMKADLHNRLGEGTTALAALEKAYALTPFDVQLNYMLALRYAEAKNAGVLRLCDSLIREDSLGLHAEPYYYKGIYFANMNEKARAISLFDEAIRHDYTFLDAYIEKGIVLYDQKKFPEAYKVFNLAMTISPEYADAYYWMAKSQQAMGQKEEARLNYQRAWGLDKTLTQAKDSADRLTR